MKNSHKEYKILILEIYEPFGKSGFTLSEAIIYRTETQEVLVNEFFDLT